MQPKKYYDDAILRYTIFYFDVHKAAKTVVKTIIPWLHGIKVKNSSIKIRHQTSNENLSHLFPSQSRTLSPRIKILQRLCCL